MKLKKSKKNKDVKVVVAMSGGVDSSVSAALLKEAGYNVVGVFMRCWNPNDFVPGQCTVEEDEHWARKVAHFLGIEFHSIDLVKEYRERVIDYFIREYRAGRTPNPDIMCNNQIKFGVFFDKAMDEFNADYIATGHYARVMTGVKSQKLKIKSKNKNQRVQLLKGVDPDKDQTYFLYKVGEEQLARTMFPIGEYTKKEVRELAKKFNLPNFDKKDSQGICFIGKVDVTEFLKEYIPPKKGPVVTTKGEKIGEHEGVHYYTIGQRKGIGIGGGMPYYVVDKNMKTNTLVVGPKYAKELLANEAIVQDVSWIGGKPKLPGKYEASIRYRQEPQEVEVKEKPDGSLLLNFKNPQRAITSGQSAVIYDKDVVLGGGVIK